MKPFIHAQNSVKKYGGKVSDYIEIHNFMDSSKSICGDNRHRIFTHNSWFISVVIERVFGCTLINSDGIEVSTRQVAEDHVREDFRNKFIPSGQDWIQNLPFEPWMENGNGLPNSAVKLHETENKPAPEKTAEPTEKEDILVGLQEAIKEAIKDIKIPAPIVVSPPTIPASPWVDPNNPFIKPWPEPNPLDPLIPSPYLPDRIFD